MELQQTLVDDVVQATDELVRIWRLMAQRQTFRWVIAMDGGVHIDAWGQSKYRLVLDRGYV